MAKRTDRFTYEEHQKMAVHLLAILEEVDHISQMFSINGGTLPSSKTTDLALKIGKAAGKLQAHLESTLNKQDGNDLRSWALYCPDIPSARIQYSV